MGYVGLFWIKDFGGAYPDISLLIGNSPPPRLDFGKVVKIKRLGEVAAPKSQKQRT